MKKLLLTLVPAAALLLLWWHPPESRESAAPLTEVSGGNARITLPDLPEDATLPAETGDFRRWAARYATAPAQDRSALLDVGRALAGPHRARIKTLIHADPRRALEEALPVRLRQSLPEELADAIEQRVNTRGDYTVLGTVGGGNESAAIHRTFQTAGGTRYEARVFGRRVRQATASNIAVHGVAIDGVLAVDEDPLRPMDPGERIPQGAEVFQTCAVSGRSAPAPPDQEITPESPAVEFGGTVHFLCSGGHIQAMREGAIAAEGGTGGPAKPTGTVPTTWSTGVKTVLYMRVTFPGQWTDPQSEKDAYDMMKSVNDFFVENSHGALHLLTTVTPLITMPHPVSWYSTNDNTNATAVLTDARAAARAAGYDYNSYDLEAVRYNGASGGFLGQAVVGSRGCWLKSSSAGVACHEFGHNLGQWHANFWNSGADSAIGSGTNQEYGNVFDTMGSANAGNYWFNAGHQNLISWIPDTGVARITSSGLYRLTQYDQPRLDPSAKYLLAIPRDAARTYWCEFRQRWTTNSWMMSGVQLGWGPWGDSATETTAYGSNAGGQLLDSTPGSLDGKNDAAVVLGRTFSDPGNGIFITPVSKGGTVPESVDVMVNVGSFPGNHPPALNLTATSLTAAVGETLTFSATATDPDGDPLAYSWDWGDRTFGPNTATASRSWSTQGLYTVRCEVSDMRGGTQSALLAITVGTPAQQRISGRVLTAEGTPVAGARVSGTQTPGSSTQRQCLSDSAGNYILSGLPAADFTVSAVHETYTISPSAFTNPVTVGTADVTADLLATAKPAVVMTLVDDSCTENGDGAVLRFTRVAASNSGALSVRVFAGGSAVTADVTFTPAPVYDLTTWRFTLPDGAATLDVAIAAVDDPGAEGPEVLNLHLVDGTGYIPSGPEQCSLLVNDNDTSLPVIGLTALNTDTSEGGAGAVLRLARTGPVGSPLVVSLTRSGTASPGADYLGINTTATIPSGAAFADLNFSPVQDTAAEGTETATFSLSSSASWIRAPLAAAASVQILDDDIPVVSVTATDSSAAEAGSDPAVFIFSRTGDVSQALTVDYAPGGTAQHGTDYWPLSGTITIPAGLASAALVITPVDDSMGEQAQTVTIAVRSSPRYVTGTGFSASATIADNDLPHLSVTVSDGTCNENNDAGKFRIQSYGTGSSSIPVLYTLSGTAAGGVDYTTVTGTVNVPRSGFADVTITPLQDTDFENAESVILTLTPDPAYTLAPENSAMLMLEDDDQPGVSVTAAASSYAENAAAARFYFTRSGATTAALSVTYSLSGTATAGADYTAPSGTLSIPAGAVGAGVDVTLTDDALSEGAESLICSVEPVPGTYGAREGTAVTWLMDTETGNLPTAAFTVASGTVAESAGTLQIPVSLSSPPAGEVRVDYAIESGTAFQSADYLASGGTLVFAAGEQQKTITLTVVDDIFREPSESIVLRLLRASAARLGNSSYTLTITDNDAAPAPVAGFTAATSTAGEGSGQPAGALIFLSAPQTTAVSLQWAVTGGTAGAGDAAALSGTLTFQPGETARTLPLAITDDADMEPSETFVITLSAPVSPLTLAPQVTHTVTVQDNDDTTVSIAATQPAASEENSAAATITVTRASPNLTQPLTVALTITGTAASGDDYQSLPTQVTIPANQTATVLSIVPLDDALLDPAETVIVSLTPSAFYQTLPPLSAAVTIADNETGITVQASGGPAAEPDHEASFIVTRTGQLGSTLSVPLAAGGTATPGDDYTALPATAEFAGGQSVITIAVMPVDDSTAEPDETITLAALPGAGYVLSGGAAALTLRDDDTNLAPLVTIQSPSVPSVYLPSGPGLVLQGSVTDDGRPAPAAPPLVNWSAVSGPGSVVFGGANSAATTAQFSAPGLYLLRLTAADAELSSSAGLSVFVLSDTFTGVNVGHTSTLTGLAGSGPAWTLTGLGSTVGTATADSTYFAHRLMSGDFTLVARVISIGSTSNSARCGVMIRGSLTPGSRHAFTSIAPGRSSFVYRTAENAAGVTSNTTLSTTAPRFVRLQRTGNAFTGATSPDGINWTTQGSVQNLALTDPVYAGLCATSGSTTATAVAEFDQFTLTPAGNVAPFVDAGLPITSGMQATLAGTVRDDGLPAVRWERRSGPGFATLPLTAAGEATFTAPGAQSLRLFAADAEAETFADTSVLVRSPFSDWQSDRFGPDAENAAVSGPRSDPDADGLENLAEYALGSDPLIPDASAGVTSQADGASLTIFWRESTGATDILIQPQWSEDLTAWSESALTVETVQSGTGWRDRRATLDISARPRAVLRVLVTLP